MTREAKTVAVVGVKSWFIHLNESLETKRNKKNHFLDRTLTLACLESIIIRFLDVPP